MSEQEIRARWRSVGDAVAEGKEIPQVTLLLAYASDVRELLDMLTTERDAATARMTCLEQRVAALETALRFYANIKEYNRVAGDPVTADPPIVHERGARARNALAAAQEEAGAGEPAQEDRCEP